MKCTILVLLTSLAITSCSTKPDQSIRLKVRHTIHIPVEYVTIYTGVYKKGTDANAIEKSGYDRLANVVALLEKLGYDDKQLEVNSGEMSKRFYDEEIYEYNGSVKFDLKELDKLDTFRRELTKAGATTFSISSYKHSKEDSIYDMAYQNAIQKAKIKADRLISNQSVKIGKILNLHENVEEVIEMASTNQMVEPPPLKLSGMPSISPVEPLFNKEYYTKSIEFTIEFALKEK